MCASRQRNKTFVELHSAAKQKKLRIVANQIKKGKEKVTNYVEWKAWENKLLFTSLFL